MATDFSLQSNERVLLEFRKHWLVHLGMFVPFILLALLPVIALSILSGTILGANPAVGSFLSFSNPWIKFLVGIYWLFVWLEAMSTFVRIHFDVWIVTNMRIIDIEQHNFFDREVNSLFLSSIEDITVEETGFFQTLARFGDIHVQTAGASERTIFPFIPQPAKVRDLLMERIRAMENIQPDHELRTDSVRIVDPTPPVPHPFDPNAK